ncbi:MAG: tetratricopeptide repeat protein [Candidatus Sericytochromatia bacterium]|nr:tetratricopeptide repeat protein [Candidatus Tanganyikabacteria bacterium]
MAARRIEVDFRATRVKPGYALGAQAAGDALFGPGEMPRDTRAATDGVRGRLRWQQTRLGRGIRPGPEGDRLDLSEDARRRSLPPDLAAAEATLDEILAEFERRGLHEHPRARALRLLKSRLLAEPGRAPAPTGRDGETMDREGGRAPGILDLLLETWDALLAMIQPPADRARHRKDLLDEVRRRTARGDQPGAERRLLLLVQRDPGDVEARARLGRLLLDRGDLAGAEPHLRAASEARPNDPARHIALGELHYQLGEPQEALIAFGKALRLKPEHSDANAWLGILAFEGDRPFEAQRFLERAVGFDPNHAVARFYLAQVSLAYGDELRASYQLGIVRRLEPGVDLERFAADEPKAIPARTGGIGYVGWVVPKPGRLAGSPTY